MIGKALKRTRQFHRLTQVELSDRLGISKSYLSELESDKKTPTIELLQKYSNVFKVPASSFLLFSESLETGKNTFKPADKILKIMDWIVEDVDEEESRQTST